MARPALTIDRLRPFAQEAVARFSLALQADELSRLVIAHQNDPVKETSGKLYYAYMRVLTAWYMSCDREDTSMLFRSDCRSWKW